MSFLTYLYFFGVFFGDVSLFQNLKNLYLCRLQIIFFFNIVTFHKLSLNIISHMNYNRLGEGAGNGVWEGGAIICRNFLDFHGKYRYMFIKVFMLKTSMLCILLSFSMFQLKLDFN